MRLFIKALKDFLIDKRRFITSMLAILLGVLSFGITMFSHNIISRELVDVYNEINPISASITVNKIDDNLIKLTNDFSEIKDYEIKSHYNLRVKTNSSETKHLELFSVNDFNNTKLNKIHYEEGEKNPKLHEALIERDAMGVANISLGDSLNVILPNNKEFPLKVTGKLADIALHPASVHNSVYLYVSHKTLSEMGLSQNKIEFILKNNKYDRDHILNSSSDYAKLLEANGYNVLSVDVPKTPGISMHLEEYQSSLFLLQVFAFVSFIFGCMIMANLISTILSGQTKQIGILKSIGASTNRIIISYMLAFCTLILSILLISLPLALFLTGKVSSFLLSFGNMHLADFSIPYYLLIIYLILILIIPLIIVYFPIQKGIKISIKEALNNTISSKDTKIPISKTKYFSRPVILSLRNALRNKKRFILNVTTLSISGAMFVAIVTSLFTVKSTISETMNSFKFDYHIVTTKPDNNIKDNFDKTIKSIPQLINYENWGSSSTKIVNKNGDISSTVSVLSPIKDSKMFSPILLEGRWLKNNSNEIAISKKFFETEPNYKLGDKINLKFDNEINEFKIVGIIKDLGSPTIFMDQEDFNLLVPSKLQYDNIKMNLDLTKNRRQVYDNVEDYLSDNNIPVMQHQSKKDMDNIVQSHFNVTMQTFLFVIFMLVIVSGFGLAVTMNSQVLERTREIGIMKAIGASRRQIIKLITIESKFITLTAWVISIFIGTPLSLLGIYIFETSLIKIPLTINFTSFITAYIIWLILTFIIASRSSKTASKRASKMTIKNALNIE